ncbi:MAG: YIP1 family protein [Longimicrobiales bacterium]
METLTHHSFVDRIKGAALLDVATYEEVEADTGATMEAGGVIALVAIAGAIGAIGHGNNAVLAGLVSGIVGWGLWAGITYIVGDKLLGGTASWGELLRTLGFAQAPALLLVFGIIPGLHLLVGLVVAIWTLITGIVAIRQALDFGTGKAIVTALFSAIILAVIRLFF